MHQFPEHEQGKAGDTLCFNKTLNRYEWISPEELKKMGEKNRSYIEMIYWDSD